jgi:hypothetical protein
MWFVQTLECYATGRINGSGVHMAARITFKTLCGKYLSIKDTYKTKNIKY